MNIKKISVLFIFIIAICLLFFQLYSFLNDDKNEISVKIAFVEPKLDSTNLSELSTIIIDKIGDDISDIFLSTYYYSKNGWSNKVAVNMPKGIVNRTKLFDILRHTLDSVLAFSLVDEVTLSNQDAITVVEAFFQKIIQEKNSEQRDLYFLAGRFPETFDSASSEFTVKRIDDVIGDSTFTSDNIVWSMCSNKDEAENAIREYLVENRGIDDKQITVPRRYVRRNNIDILIFSRIADNKRHAYIDHINKNDFENVKLNLIAGNFNQKYDIILSDSISLSSKLNYAFDNAESVNWKSFKFMIQQIVNKYSSDSLNTKSSIYFIGEVPYGNSKITDISGLKDKNYLQFFIDIQSKKRGLNIEKVFLNVFKSINLQISRIN